MRVKQVFFIDHDLKLFAITNCEMASDITVDGFVNYSNITVH